jgi:hypothetical protein
LRPNMFSVFGILLGRRINGPGNSGAIELP